MKPRGYWGSLLTVGAIVLPLSIILWPVLFSVGPMTLGEAFSSTGLWVGLIFGVFMTLAMAFVVRRRTITLAVQDKNAFISDMTKTLAAAGYHLESQGENVLTFGPSARAGILAPNVVVEVGDTSATIAGPRLPLKRLQKGV
jgi:hypothetical protein